MLKQITSHNKAIGFWLKAKAKAKNFALKAMAKAKAYIPQRNQNLVTAVSPQLFDSDCETQQNTITTVE